MASNIKIHIERTDSDDNREVLFVCQAPENSAISEDIESRFLKIIEPLKLDNPKGVFVIACSIAYGIILDKQYVANMFRPNDFDDDIRRLFELLHGMRDWNDIEAMRISLKMKDKTEIQSFNLPHKEFYDAVVNSIITTYRKKFVLDKISKAYDYEGLSNNDFIKNESERLNNMRGFYQEYFKHRPNTNNRNYALLILFFSILKIEPTKDNCNIMIELFQLFGLWKEKIEVNNSSYKLVIRQWHTAKKRYQLVFKNGVFQDKEIYKGLDIEFEY